MQDIRQVVAEPFAAVNQVILDQLHSHVPLVENIGHYIVEAGGKRLRPLLVLLSAGACGNIHRDQITLAAVIEFIHTATLLHDDVVDRSNLRRGRPTANARWGNAPSVLVGDFLYSRAFQLLVAIGHLPLMRLLADTTNTIAEGEVLQLTRAGDPATTEEAYFEVIERKTAVLFASACEGAALLADADPAATRSLARFGQHLGTAFQLADDVLDYRGDSSIMGKQVGDDLFEGKPTLPLIHVLRHGSSAERTLVERAIRERDARDLDAVLKAVMSAGSLDYTLARAAREAESARKCLAPLPASPCRDAMERLCVLAVQRDS